MSTQSIELPVAAAPLPGFVGLLLGQTRAPDDIPQIAADDTTGWLRPLVDGLLSWLRAARPATPAMVSLVGDCARLPLPGADGQRLYLRLPQLRTWTVWPIETTSVVMVLVGTVDAEVYRSHEDLRAGHPQYARSFGPEDLFAVHVGAELALRSQSPSVQLVASRRPVRGPAGIRPLPDGPAFYDQAEQALERIVEGVR